MLLQGCIGSTTVLVVWATVLFLPFLSVGFGYSSQSVADHAATLFNNVTANCQYTQREGSLEVFYLNLDRSGSRKRHMEAFYKQMGLVAHRVRAFSLKDFHIPSDILRVIESKGKIVCVEETAFPPQNSSSSLEGHSMLHSKYRKVYAKAVCGNAVNTAKELVTVSSHIYAMKQAIDSKTATSKYALITEDDVWSPFDIDFDELIEALPSLDFGILQLFNSKGPAVIYDLKTRYARGKFTAYLRAPAVDGRYLPTFSTGAYLINREVMKPIIDQLIVQEESGWMAMHIMAGTSIPFCRPLHCCPNHTESKPSFDFQTSYPACVWAPVGYQADSFLFALAKTYVYTIPLFVDGPGSEESTIHQHHVIRLHQRSFQQIRNSINQLLARQIKLPHYIKLACPNLTLKDF